MKINIIFLKMLFVFVIVIRYFKEDILSFLLVVNGGMNVIGNVLVVVMRKDEVIRRRKCLFCNKD